MLGDLHSIMFSAGETAIGKTRRWGGVYSGDIAGLIESWRSRWDNRGVMSKPDSNIPTSNTLRLVYNFL